MSKRYNNGSHYENHQKAGELQDGAAHAHRTAVETREKQDHETGEEMSRRALEPSSKPLENSGHGHAVNEHGVPIFGHKDIAVLAYQLWQSRGCPEGSPDEDWFRAARDLRAQAEVHGMR
jgi:hypothetical protein